MINVRIKKPCFFRLSFLREFEEKFFHFGDVSMPQPQIKVEVKQGFDNVDAIIFEAALLLNEIETKYKQKEYVS
jgi:hypothetical protein